MTAAQTRLAETIDSFYGAADRTSDGAMAAHAYKSGVTELDNGILRELVRAPTLALTRFSSHTRRTRRTGRASWSRWER